jgi:hypothetical protein
VDSVDVSSLLSIVTKGGPAAIILAVFYGLATLVREVRSGKVSAGREADLSKRVDTLETEMLEIKTALAKALGSLQTMRYQRDQARVRVEFLELKHGEQPRSVWPADSTGGTP